MSWHNALLEHFGQNDRGCACSHRSRGAARGGAFASSGVDSERSSARSRVADVASQRAQQRGPAGQRAGRRDAEPRFVSRASPTATRSAGSAAPWSRAHVSSRPPPPRLRGPRAVRGRVRERHGPWMALRHGCTGHGALGAAPVNDTERPRLLVHGGAGRRGRAAALPAATPGWISAPRGGIHRPPRRLSVFSETVVQHQRACTPRWDPIDRVATTAGHPASGERMASRVVGAGFASRANCLRPRRVSERLDQAARRAPSEMADGHPATRGIRRQAARRPKRSKRDSVIGWSGARRTPANTADPGFGERLGKAVCWVPRHPPEA